MSANIKPRNIFLAFNDPVIVRANVAITKAAIEQANTKCNSRGPISNSSIISRPALDAIPFTKRYSCDTSFGDSTAYQACRSFHYRELTKPTFARNRIDCPAAWRRSLQGNSKSPPAFAWRACLIIWHRPTLEGPCGPTTIGAGGLNCRVRDGNGWNPTAMGARNLIPMR